MGQPRRLFVTVDTCAVENDSYKRLVSFGRWLDKQAQCRPRPFPETRLRILVPLQLLREQTGLLFPTEGLNGSTSPIAKAIREHPEMFIIPQEFTEISQRYLLTLKELLADEYGEPHPGGRIMPSLTGGEPFVYNAADSAHQFPRAELQAYYNRFLKKAPALDRSYRNEDETLRDDLRDLPFAKWPLRDRYAMLRDDSGELDLSEQLLAGADNYGLYRTASLLLTIDMGATQHLQRMASGQLGQNVKPYGHEKLHGTSIDRRLMEALPYFRKVDTLRQQAAFGAIVPGTFLRHVDSWYSHPERFNDFYEGLERRRDRLYQGRPETAKWSIEGLLNPRNRASVLTR